MAKQVFYTNGQTKTATIDTGDYCTNYKAEEAIRQAVIIVVEDAKGQRDNVAIFTDDKSAMEGLSNYKQPTLSNKLQQLAQNLEVVLQWIPTHTVKSQAIRNRTNVQNKTANWYNKSH